MSRRGRRARPAARTAKAGVAAGGARRWVIGAPALLEAGDALVALDLYELREADRRRASAVAFHEVMEGAAIQPAGEVWVQVPRWRGHRFLDTLEWLVCSRLAAPGARVTWVADRRGGATGVRRLLEARSWEFSEAPAGPVRRFTGVAPRAGARPEPDAFRDRLGSVELELAADWGVFSSQHIDPGTRLLFEAALAFAPLETVVDVGTGYGALAIGLVATGAARHATGTDVDSVALSLARLNARRAKVEAAFPLEDDPQRVDPSPLTVCALPTHIPRERADPLLTALAARARCAPLLLCVHASLEDRYARRLAREGCRTRRVGLAEHAVLRAEAAPA